MYQGSNINILVPHYHGNRQYQWGTKSHAGRVQFQLQEVVVFNFNTTLDLHKYIGMKL